MYFFGDKIPTKELRKDAKKTIQGIEGWFKRHPSRRVCKARLWYGVDHKIHRGQVAEEINRVMLSCIKMKFIR